MAWLKSSDTSYDHPIVVAPLAWPADHLDGQDPYDLAGLLFGLAWRCATYCAQKGLDYFIPDEAVAMIAGLNWQLRAAQLAKAGYWTRAELREGWDLVDDAEHLFHIRRKDEIDWERARKRDNANPALTVPVRLRDGDGCRYCGHIVQWSARRGNRAGTYDHRTPGTPATSPDDLVVACGSCNRTRSNNPDAEAWPLLPAPTDPHYGTQTLEFLARYGRHITAPGEPAPSGPTPGEPAPSGPTPPQDGARGASAADRSADSAERAYPLVRNPGRVGAQVGSHPRRRKRGRRGGRARGPDHERGEVIHAHQDVRADL